VVVVKERRTCGRLDALDVSLEIAVERLVPLGNAVLHHAQDLELDRGRVLVQSLDQEADDVGALLVVLPGQL